MTLVLFQNRMIAVAMVTVIFLIGMPMMSASAVTCCDHMSMPASMAIDMKSSIKTQNKPEKPRLPCDNSLCCLGSAGCCAPVIDRMSVISIPNMAMATADWISLIAGPTVTYKPALPPPIISV